MKILQGWKKCVLKASLVVSLMVVILIVAKPPKRRNSEDMYSPKNDIFPGNPFPKNVQMHSKTTARRKTEDERPQVDQGRNREDWDEEDERRRRNRKEEEGGEEDSREEGEGMKGRRKEEVKKQGDEKERRTMMNSALSTKKTPNAKALTRKPLKDISKGESQTILKTSQKIGKKDLDKTLEDVKSQSTSDPLMETVRQKTKDGMIVISTVDFAYTELALNLWETSIKKFRITNHLFLCMDQKSKAFLAKNGVQCYQYIEDPDGSKALTYNSAGYNRKSKLKTQVALDILSMGYTVFVVDVDIVFLKNPMPYMHCEDCDLIIQNDGTQLNSGFYVAKPTRGGKMLYEMSVNHSNATAHDQAILNDVIRQLQSQDLLKVVVLDINTFLPGDHFFTVQRMFAFDQKCKDCVVVHNNYVVGFYPKVYRFKEMLLWMVDIDEYYTNQEAKFIFYSNPVTATAKQEKEALDKAFYLAKTIGRIVILPRFNCPPRLADKRKICNALRTLDGRYFRRMPRNLYRESVFLSHPRVPSKVKKSLSPIINIKRNSKGNTDTNAIDVPLDLDESKIVDYIIGHLHSHQDLEVYSVLRFGSLVIE